MFDLIATYLRELNTVSILVRFALAIICGGIIGMEREHKRQAAGFRTHILVCVGSAIAMMTGQFIADVLHYTSDPARLGAQVISGIGFLGVGTIIITQSQKVRGLTTAAGLWTAACIGLAIGIGFYEAALIGTLLVLITVVVLQRLDEFFCSRSTLSEFYIELAGVQSIKTLLALLQMHHLRVSSLDMRKSHYSGEQAVGLVLTVKRTPESDKSKNLIDIIGSMEGLVFIEELT